MNDSRLEPYRDEILTMKMQGMSTAAMQRQIEQSHRVTIKKSQFYAFVNRVTGDTTPEPEEEFSMPTKSQLSHSPIDEEVRAFYVNLPLKLDEMRRELANVIHYQAQLDQKEDRREQSTRAALEQLQRTLAEVMAVRQAEAARANSRPPEAPRPIVTPAITSAFRATRRAMPSFALPAPRSWNRALLYSGMMWGAGILLFGYGYWRSLWALLASLFGSLIASLPLHT